jgi:hypothetical protein
MPQTEKGSGLREADVGDELLRYRAYEIATEFTNPYSLETYSRR